MNQKIKDEIDVLFSLYIRTRDGWKCQNPRCGLEFAPPTSQLHCSHFRVRSKMPTRWDPKNSVSFCYICHPAFENNSKRHQAFFLKKLGQEEFDDLILRSNSGEKPDVDSIRYFLVNGIKEMELGLWKSF